MNLRLSTLNAVLLTLALGHVRARADDILVFQRLSNDPQMADTAGPEAASVLEELGHTVTRAIAMNAPLPADLSVFDAIYVVEIVPLSGPQQTALRAYVNAGGALYLTGERSCCEPSNSAATNLQRLLCLVDSTFGMLSDGTLPLSAAPGDRTGIPSMPNASPDWQPIAPGLMSLIPAENQVFVDSMGRPLMAAWTGEHLAHGSGCLLVAMDISYLIPSMDPTQDRAPILENIQRFLSTCNDSDGDGVSDASETAAGTQADDPDSDDDGLCDGHATVTGVCVDGDGFLRTVLPADGLYYPVDSDMDGTRDALDQDDDGDGIPTRFEVMAEMAAPDVDGDELPAWLDPDSDNNFIPDAIEGMNDFNGNGIPSIVERDDDPTDCNEDADCAVADSSGPICDLELEYCGHGCRSSSDAAVGPCLDGGVGEDGGTTELDAGMGVDAGDDVDAGMTDSDGGVMRTDSGAMGRDAGAMGGDASAPLDGGRDDTVDDDGGCGCATPGRRYDTRSPVLLLSLTVIVFSLRALRRRRRLPR